jgi:hypothetical protein
MGEFPVVKGTQETRPRRWEIALLPGARYFVWPHPYTLSRLVSALRYIHCFRLVGYKQGMEETKTYMIDMACDAD